MNEVSIIINGERFDAIDDKDAIDNSRCAFYSMETHCGKCIIGMDCCEQLIGIDGVFKKSTKIFER